MPVTVPATVSEALRTAVPALQAAGVESAAHDARMLMAAALSAEQAAERPGAAPVGALDLMLRGGDPAPAGFAGMLDRRVAREPLQWILGHGSVLGLDLAVEPGVFIPRPETDLLIDWAAGAAEQRVDRRDRGEDADLFSRLLEPTLTVVDFCSGPGTVTLGLAHLLTARGLADRAEIRLVGLEITGDGVRLARRNLQDWVGNGHIDPRITVEFHVADAASRDAVTGLGLVGSADLVLSNPPYVPETTEVSPEVAADPHDAVFSGPDGLELMRPLASVIELTAAPGAAVAVEHDDTTGADVQALLSAAGVDETAQHRDFAGRDRFVTGRVHRDPGHRPARV